ncbi:uncharacterized protein EDB91DRAFT_1254402 [Suillus paluster]|uniref:uncharacterized protein n=1 Tax=Suillus paluster TaxID=48578 RepID=UPI001B867267|nr:uncharacterized protein EDB91DRAFT_1254402 [Suillus paluster]KAG1726260.1 hypothetical protein EDB91DRAFT_1254402 [Suillus paluster]
MPDQHIINQEVDDDTGCPSANLSSSPTLDIDTMFPSMLQNSTTYPNLGFAVVVRPTMVSSPNHLAQPALPGPRMTDGSPSSTGYSCHNFNQVKYSIQSVSTPNPWAMAIPQLHSIYSVSSPTIPTSFSHYGSWNNPPTLHTSQNDVPVLGRDHSSSYTFPMQYSNVHHSHPAFPSQYTRTNQDIYFTSDYEMPTAPYNNLPQQWCDSVISQPPRNVPLPPIVPPPLAAESSQIRDALQPFSSHGGNICYPSDQPPTSHPHSIPFQSHPSSPLLLSCRWLRDDVPCEFAGTLEELKVHCKTAHFSGPPNAQIECRWEACEYHKRDDPAVRVMRRGCMWRHTREVHLGMKRGA